MNKCKHQNSLGFTLIELLVVISIISLTSSAILAITRFTQVEGRDQVRLLTLIQVRNALELYVAGNGHYPITVCIGSQGGSWISPDVTYQGYNTLGTCDVINGPMTTTNFNDTMSQYMTPIHDPKATFPDNYSGYWYKSNGIVYKFQNVSSPENLNNFPVSFIDPAICGLPITVNGDCSGPGYQGYPGGGYYQLRAIAVWSSEWTATYPND